MPQPIDPFTELGRMQAAERIQQIADRASLAAQARVSSETAAAATNKETQVQQMEAKSSEVDEALKRKAPFVGRRRRKRDEDEDESSRTFYDEHEKRRVAGEDTGIDFDVSI